MNKEINIKREARIRSGMFSFSCILVWYITFHNTNTNSDERKIYFQYIYSLNTEKNFN